MTRCLTIYLDIQRYLSGSCTSHTTPNPNTEIMNHNRLLQWALAIIDSQRWIIKSGGTFVRSVDDISQFEKINKNTEFIICEELIDRPWYFLWLWRRVIVKEVGRVSCVANANYLFAPQQILVELFDDFHPLRLVQQMRRQERESGLPVAKLEIVTNPAHMSVTSQSEMVSATHSQG